MPVNRLLVEGHLDAEVLSAVCAGNPTVEPAMASKNALEPRVRTERRKGVKGLLYLRDRDFDFEPPTQFNRPCEDRFDGDDLLGWRWCRHSMENYLLEPAIVCAALSVQESPYRLALIDAAKRIQYYQAARWAVGIARRALPPFYELRTYPEGLSDFSLPDDLARNACETWVVTQVKTFVDRVTPPLGQASVIESFRSRVVLFESQVTGTAEAILIWFCGRDLMVALRDWWARLDVAGPKDFCNRLRDWTRTYPEEALKAIPEWQGLLDTLRATR